MEVSQIQFNFWIFFSNAVCALLLNFSIFLVIGRTGAVTVRVAGVLKDWILIALSTVVFPESTITGLNITGYAIGKFSSYYFIEKLTIYYYILPVINICSHFLHVLVFSSALCGVVLYNYLKVKDVRASQASELLPERITKVTHHET